jgi:hypothetical protein
MSSIFDPGKKDRNRAATAAAEGVFSGGNITGPGGISAGFDFSGGKVTSNLSAGGFQPVIEAFQQFGADAIGGIGGFELPPELKELGLNTIAELGDIDLKSMGGKKDLAGLGKIFDRSVTTASKDPFELGSEISDRLRGLSERRNNRLVAKTFDRLKASGKLGTTGGAGIAGELDATLQEQDLKFDLAGLDFGQRQIGDAISAAFGASQGREGIKSRMFQESAGIEQLEGNRALQQFGVGDQLFQDFLAGQHQTLQTGQVGLAATGMAGNLSQLPLAFMQAMQNAGTAASNTNFAQAGVFQNNAAMAKSPFLEFMNTVGELFSVAKPGGI